ncbi:MAG: zinc ribbon domain-containing protein [Anaerolineae bacterium]
MHRAQALYKLQVIELEVSEGSQRLAEVESSLGENQELHQARRALEERENDLAGWRKKLRDLELEAKSLSNKISSVEDRLYSGRIHNPKELASLQEEVQYLKRRRSKLEDEMLEAMIEIEESEADVAKLRAELAQVEEDWRRGQAQLSTERDELKARLGQLEGQRAELRGAIKASDLSLYERLCHQKGGRGVALLKVGVCQGCGVTLPTSQAQQVRQGQNLSTCGSCGRILYAG